MSQKQLILILGIWLSALVGCKTNELQSAKEENAIIGIGSINGTRVSARGKPTTFSHMVFQFNKGEPVKILEKIANPNPDPYSGVLIWLKVQVPADVGLWVYGAFLEDLHDSRQRRVNASLLHVRSGAGKNFSILDRLPRGTLVRPTGVMKGDWVEIFATRNASVYVADPFVGNREKADRYIIENEIRRHIKKPEGQLTKADLEKVDWLSFKRDEITCLTQLSGLKNLTNLDLRYTLISDLSPLAELTKLKYLHLNGAENLSMAEIRKLQAALPDCIIEFDLGHQRSLGQIIKETMHDSNYELEAIEDFKANYGDITNLKPLVYAKMGPLKRLDLANNMISDLAPLSAMTDLEVLDLDYNRITDLTPIKDLTKLRRLHVYFGLNKIADLTPLKEMKNLKTLSLNCSPTTDLMPLINLSNLEELNINFTTEASGASRTLAAEKQIEDNLAQRKMALIKLKKALPRCKIFCNLLDEPNTPSPPTEQEIQIPDGTLAPPLVPAPIPAPAPIPEIVPLPLLPPLP